MPTLKTSEVRQRIAAVLAALRTTQAPWAESRAAYDKFPASAAPTAHLEFAVGTPGLAFDGIEGSRRRVAVGGIVGGQFFVKWLYRVRGDNAVADYDLALDTENDVFAALLRVAGEDGLHLSIVNVTRATADGTDLLLTTVTVDAGYRVALS